jgi:radical SAM superfamily enzyme YgiQ (UPF0313 family)
MTRCLLVYPEFRSASFWNYRETCHLRGARYPAAPLGLITVAAMLPADREVRLVDRNVQTWDDSLLDWPDVVLTGGMIPQQRDCLDLIHTIKQRGQMVIVGGPDATNSPHLYAEADPFEFTTEASLNLADDQALLTMMQDVGFFAVFVGIESPDERTLIGTQKRQNTGRSIVHSIRTIYKYGSS